MHVEELSEEFRIERKKQHTISVTKNTIQAHQNSETVAHISTFITSYIRRIFKNDEFES